MKSRIKIQRKETSSRLIRGRIETTNVLLVKEGGTEVLGRKERFQERKKRGGRRPFPKGNSSPITRQ